MQEAASNADVGKHSQAAAELLQQQQMRESELAALAERVRTLQVTGIARLLQQFRSHIASGSLQELCDASIASATQDAIDALSNASQALTEHYETYQGFR